MPKVELLRIVVASPGDVKPERDCVESVAAELNRGLADVLGMRLEVVRWETDSFPGFNQNGSQGHIDTALRIEESDLVVGIFWKRFGSPVADAASGTEHEIRGAYRSWERSGRPQIMVYFNPTAPEKPTALEAEQWQKVQQFQKDPMFKKGLWWNYNGPAEFEKLVRAHLTQYLRHRTAPVEMEVHSVESPLGLIELSNVRSEPGRARPHVTPGLQNYRNPRFGFQIAWPMASWVGNDNPWMLQQVQMQMGLPPTIAVGLIVTCAQPVMGFLPNVNVVVEPAAFMSIGDLMRHYSMIGPQYGQQEVTSEADERTQSGFRAFFASDPFGRQLFQFQRIALGAGYVFTVTASQLPPMDQIGLRLRDELATILSSFRLG